MDHIIHQSRGCFGASVALFLSTVALTVAHAEAADSVARVFTTIETTHLRNSSLGNLDVRVEAQLDESGQAFRVRVVIMQGRRAIQRFEIKSDTRTYVHCNRVAQPRRAFFSVFTLTENEMPSTQLAIHPLWSSYIRIPRSAGPVRPPRTTRLGRVTRLHCRPRCPRRVAMPVRHRRVGCGQRWCRAHPLRAWHHR